jgi:hypothetical protein
MRRLHCFAICALLLVGCSSPEAVRQSAGFEGAVADLNRQIEKFNAERPGDMGITPIAQRVSRVEGASDGAAVSCFDAEGVLFLVLTRQPDGSFKGSLRTKYHELPKPDGHSWGEVVAEFTLPQKMGSLKKGGAKGLGESLQIGRVALVHQCSFPSVLAALHCGKPLPGIRCGTSSSQWARRGPSSLPRADRLGDSWRQAPLRAPRASPCHPTIASCPWAFLQGIGHWTGRIALGRACALEGARKGRGH